MAELKTELNLAFPDDFYEALVALHRGLTDEQSEMANARLILLLANHIGDMSVLREAMRWRGRMWMAMTVKTQKRKTKFKSVDAEIAEKDRRERRENQRHSKLR